MRLLGAWLHELVPITPSPSFNLPRAGQAAWAAAGHHHKPGKAMGPASICHSGLIFGRPTVCAQGDMMPPARRTPRLPRPPTDHRLERVRSAEKGPIGRNRNWRADAKVGAPANGPPPPSRDAPLRVGEIRCLVDAHQMRDLEIVGRVARNLPGQSAVHLNLNKDEQQDSLDRRAKGVKQRHPHRSQGLAAEFSLNGLDRSGARRPRLSQ